MATHRRAFLAVAAITLAGVAAWLLLAARPGRVASLETGPVSAGGELIASIRSEPSTYNRYLPAGAAAATDLVSQLIHARLVRVNRSTDQLEPALAETWTQSDDGLTYTLRVREGIQWPDGVPFTSADALFTFRVAYDGSVKSPIGSALQINGKPLQISAPDARTIVLTFPEPFAPGLRLLDNLPILPRHKLEAALNAGRLADEWTPGQPLSNVLGLGPFRLVEHVAGQRLVFEANPQYFKRDPHGNPLPYLERLTLAVVPDQTTEGLRLEAGETDLLAHGEIRPQDYAAFKRAADGGRIRLLDVGVGLDPDFLSFNLRASKQSDPRWSWLGTPELRRAIAWGVDRQAIADTVYLGAAVPVSGPITPGNRTWYSPETPTFSHDPDRARQLLASIGLRDIDGDGMLEDGSGTPVRFSIITQAGHNRERVASMLQQQLRALGIAIDIVPLDQRALIQRWSAADYDAMYFGLQASSTDPWLNSEFWLSSGAFHLWNPGQPSPATDWERRIDALMRDNAGTSDLAGRQRAFAEMQRLFAEALPSIYLVAPRLMLAVSPRVQNPTPAPQNPQLLWAAETLGSSRAGSSR